MSMLDLNLVPIDNAAYYYDDDVALAPQGNILFSRLGQTYQNLSDATNQGRFMAKEDVTPVGPDLIEEICSDMTMKLTEKIGEGSLLSTITQAILIDIY